MGAVLAGLAVVLIVLVLLPFWWIGLVLRVVRMRRKREP